MYAYTSAIPYMQTCVYLPAQMYSHNTGTAQWLGFQVPDRRLQGIAQSLTTHTEVSQPASPESHSIPPTREGPSGLTCRRERTAHSSKVSAASSLPWRRYSAPRFLRVVFTVGLWEQVAGEWEPWGYLTRCLELPTNLSYLLTLQALYQPPYSA